MCAAPGARLLKVDKELQQVVVDAAADLLRALGSMTVLNYNEFVAKARADAGAAELAPIVPELDCSGEPGLEVGWLPGVRSAIAKEIPALVGCEKRLTIRTAEPVETRRDA
jgi:hypothetical protein